MQESKEPIERPDLFSSYLRERLEDHHIPVDADGWEGVESMLRRRTARRRWLAVAGAVAAMLTGFVLLLPFHKDMPEVPHLAEQPVAIAPLAVQPKDNSPVEPPQAVSPITIQPARSRLLTTAALPEEKAAGAADAVSEIPVSTNETLVEELPTEDQAPPAPVRKKRTADVPADGNGYKAKTDAYRPSPTRRNVRSEWLVAAGFGMGSSVDISISAEKDYAINDPSASPSLGNSQNEYFNSDPEKESSWYLGKDAQPGQFSDVTYHLPLSFGMTVRKFFSSRFALESGLIYTYLRTGYSGGNQMMRKAEFRYHYIGIPVNMVAYLVDRPQWNLYLSGGIMAEKGIRGAWEGTSANGINQISHQSGTFSISGLQWSFNTSLGVSYRLQRQWSLYAEPRFSYFFDNNQPETARTDHSISIGIGGGIRFEF